MAAHPGYYLNTASAYEVCNDPYITTASSDSHYSAPAPTETREPPADPPPWKQKWDKRTARTKQREPATRRRDRRRRRTELAKLHKKAMKIVEYMKANARGK